MGIYVCSKWLDLREIKIGVCREKYDDVVVCMEVWSFSESRGLCSGDFLFSNQNMYSILRIFLCVLKNVRVKRLNAL